MTDAIENKLSDFLLDFIREYLALMSSLKGRGGIVDIHKKCLGNPDRLWVGGSERRKFAIWQMGDLTILVHKEKGSGIGSTTKYFTTQGVGDVASIP